MQRWRRVAAWVAALGCVIAGARAARAQPAQAPTPSVEVRVRHITGPPLASGAVAPVSSTLSPEDAVPLRVVVLGLEAVPDLVAEPLCQSVELCASTTAPRPLLAAPDLLRRTRAVWHPQPESLISWLEQGRAGAVRRLAELRTVLIPGATTVLAMARTDVGPNRESRRSALVLYRDVSSDPPRLQVGVFTQRLLRVSGEDPRPADEFLLARPHPFPLDQDGEGLALLTGEPGTAPREAQPELRALAAIVSIRTAPPADDPSAPAHAVALADALRGLEPPLRLPALPSAVALAPAEGANLQADLHALAHPATLRLGLLRLAQGTGTPFLAELAQAAPLAILSELVTEASEGAPPLIELDPAGLGWRLERAALQVALHDPAPAPSLRVALRRELGPLAQRTPSVLAELDDAPDPEAFRAGLVERMRRFLSHRQAALRLDACLWLRARGVALAGYDPLAPRAERDAALAADEQ